MRFALQCPRLKTLFARQLCQCHAAQKGESMKITGLKTFIVGNPPPYNGGRYFIFVKLTASNGIEGIGEV